ncbi:MalY/PatB family protein [Pseudovibrio sp. Tun.PSC04-5.I4]|uniref:MalY/PatB family protein n=1 Tax=Pseudovibrio sp. Tun.PSC04-5.I4 TaxID=1798213 RepID=UPI000890DADE|nr:MalY/PatB family protein [Pseudovibrio sp. Tun.PSC04-5.I4]SDR35024.1 cystathione beta-lyase [Pseudovibrio sp. Tun.PSC04-5.I4]
MTYDLDRIVDRTGTDSIKWEYIERNFPDAKPDTLSMWVADMDFACAPAIVTAIKDRADKEIFGYNYATSEAYSESVVGWFKRRFDWDVEQEKLAYSPGIIPALNFLVNILCNEGEGVIIQRPVYYPFTRIIEENKRKLVNNSLLYVDGSYEMDFVDLEQQLKDPNNKILMFCSPQNPTGRVWTKEELSRVIALCKENDVWIISDEIHFDLVKKGIVHTPLEMIDPSYKDKIITCTAPSKSFNLAGLQISNIIIHDEALRTEWKQFTHMQLGIEGPNSFAMAATQAAYNDGEEWLDEVNAYIDNNFNYMEAFVKEHLPKVKMVEREGTYLAWLDFRGYGLTEDALRLLMIKEANLTLDDGFIFGAEGTGFQRFNLACPNSFVVRCMASIQKAVSTLG